jgi:hypothetical protein
MRLSRSELLPHERLLCACAATWTDSTTRRRLDAALSQPNLNWPAFVRQSVRHGLAPCAALHLRGFAGDSRLPAPISACFERMYRGNAHRNQVLFRETARLLRAFDAAGIRSRALKGVGLALTIYPDPALRNFADLDILVEAAQFAAAGAVARSCGFVQEPTPEDGHCAVYIGYCAEDILTDTLAPEFDPTVTPEILARHRHQIVLELHNGRFRDASGSVLETDSTPFWDCPQTAVLPDGTVMQVPAKEVTLTYLALHAASHLYRRLVFPLDMALILRRYGAELDWNQVCDLADRIPARAEVYRMLGYLQREFAAEIPVEVWPRLKPSEHTARIEPPLTTTAMFDAMHLDASEQSWQLLRRSAGPRAFLASACRIIFPSRQIMQRIYKAKSPLLITLLYLTRPFRIGRLFLQVMYRRIVPPDRTVPLRKDTGQPHLLPTDRIE